MADDIQRKPANDNFWYRLMTAHGEMPADAELNIFGQWENDQHQKLADKNRLTWNRWWWTWLQAHKADLAWDKDKLKQVADSFDETEKQALSQDQQIALSERLVSFDDNPDIDPKSFSDLQVLDLSNLEFGTAFSAFGLKFLVSISCELSAWRRAAKFDSATFSGEASFHSATFSGEAWFDSATFSGDARFDSATFSGDASFNSATFSGDADFPSATFSGNADFPSATFSGNASFPSATFSGDASFPSATFSGYANFNSATFSGYANFNSATFSGYAWFPSATFSGDAWFHSATFSGDANFDSATFSGDANFDSATFSGDARFDSATFSGDANFDSATFSGDANFDSATFSGDARFDSATFSGHARFDSATFSGHARFDSATVVKALKAMKAVFEKSVSFKNAKIEGRAWFRGTEFGGDVDFDQAKIGSNTPKQAWRLGGFPNAKFNGRVNFTRANINNTLIFNNASFGSDVLFTKTEMNASLWMTGADVSGHVKLDGAVASATLNFDLAQLKKSWCLKKIELRDGASISANQMTVDGAADLSTDNPNQALLNVSLISATFRSSLDLNGRRFDPVPQFQGTELKAAFLFDKDENTWPEPEAKDFDAYERLRSIMASQGRKGMEIFFQRREHIARLKGFKPLSFRQKLTNPSHIILGFYRDLSDFGHSLWRPFARTLLLFAAVVIVNSSILTLTPVVSIWGVDFKSTPGHQVPGHQVPGDQVPGDQVPGDQVPGHPAPGEASTAEKVQLAFQLAGAGTLTVVPPPRFTVGRQHYGAYGWLIGINAVQRLLSAFFLLLFGLALRNRLRMAS